MLLLVRITEFVVGHLGQDQFIIEPLLFSLSSQETSLIHTAAISGVSFVWKVKITILHVCSKLLTVYVMTVLFMKL